MSLDRLRHAKSKAVGAKQTAKAVQAGTPVAVFVAQDADGKVVNGIVQGCQEKNIPVYYVESMSALGKASGIEVGAAVVAVLEW